MNDFTHAEFDLVTDICTRFNFKDLQKSAIDEIIKKCANWGVKAYAKPYDQDASTQAVIELVEERLNAH